MKTKEFIEKIKKLGCYIRIGRVTIFIIYCDVVVATIHREYPYSLNTSSIFKTEDAEELFDLCVKYAKTPIEDREEKKKYHLYLKNKNREFYESIYRYLTLRKKDNTFSLDVGVETAGLTSKFTQEKIDWIKERFNTDLEEFEQIEVEE